MTTCDYCEHPRQLCATTCRTTELLLLPPPPLVGLVGLVVHFTKPLSHYEETSTNIQDAQHQHWNVNSHLINNKLRPENPEIGRNIMKYHCIKTKLQTLWDLSVQVPSSIRVSILVSWPLTFVKKLREPNLRTLRRAPKSLEFQYSWNTWNCASSAAHDKRRQMQPQTMDAMSAWHHGKDMHKSGEKWQALDINMSFRVCKVALKCT